MSLWRSLTKVLEIPALYALWQAPFVRQKLVPLRPYLPALQGKRILELGCGPGTNAGLFATAEYAGIDLSPSYVASAARRFSGHHFVCADAAAPAPFRPGTFDACLINSLLHHLDDAQVSGLLKSVTELLKPEGGFFLIDLVLPPAPGIARILAKADRGAHARSFSRWQELLNSYFELHECKEFSVSLMGCELWRLFFAHAVPKQPSN